MTVAVAPHVSLLNNNVHNIAKSDIIEALFLANVSFVFLFYRNPCTLRFVNIYNCFLCSSKTWIMIMSFSLVQYDHKHNLTKNDVIMI